MTPVHVLVAAAATAMTASTCPADVVEFTDKAEWIAAVGPFTTVDFTGFPHGTLVTDQFADQGVIFTDGDDSIFVNPGTFLNDGVGLDGNGDINVAFDTPQFWIGVEFPGDMQIDLFHDGQLIGSTVHYGAGDVAFFAGVLSSEPFDAALLNSSGQAAIDDLYFGPPPCPGDFGGDGVVGILDFFALLTVWGTDPGGPPDLDGDGTVGIADFLELLAQWGPCSFFVDCNGNGVFDLLDVQGGASPDCNGNGIPDECDIADGTSPDIDGTGIPDECEPPANDRCEDAMAISDGAVSFRTVGATAEGPPALCGDFSTIVNDIWYLYTATCTGSATFSVCNDVNFDSRMAVYFGDHCPPLLNPLACSDDAAGCGQGSEAQLHVSAGIEYLIRIGGADGGGDGILTVSCEP